MTDFVSENLRLFQQTIRNAIVVVKTLFFTVSAAVSCGLIAVYMYNCTGLKSKAIKILLPNVIFLHEIVRIFRAHIKIVLFCFLFEFVIKELLR